MDLILPPNIVIEDVSPEINDGLFTAKCVIGEPFPISAKIFKDCHHIIQASIRYKEIKGSFWKESRMILQNDDCLWLGHLNPDNECTQYLYKIEAWVDPLLNWQHELKLHLNNDAVQISELHKQIKQGISLFDELKTILNQKIDRDFINSQVLIILDKLIIDIKSESINIPQIRDILSNLISNKQLAEIIFINPIKYHKTQYHKELELFVQRKIVGFSSWYEMFPRSFGTFQDCYKHLDHIKDLGFNVVYFPPIHPIGQTNRKGKNNSLIAEPEDVGSPWAIGGPMEGGRLGGHKDIHSDLGTLKDFKELVRYAKFIGLEIALDLAFQCSPDHPYIDFYPNWFQYDCNGEIKHAENPPKKYEDVYPLDFYSKDYKKLWDELKNIVLYWILHGVKIFRVDNPHTKPLRFWHWLIHEIHKDHPDVVFLAEAFTKPSIMKFLSKAGFSQSYTYFTWINDKQGLTNYFTELTQSSMQHYFRGNLFTNTPDILSEYLQTGGPSAFHIRLILAATLSNSYGIYSGYELYENVPVHEGSEEYLDSEKYEIKQRNWDTPHNMKDLIKTINRIRTLNPALQEYSNLEFFPSTNPNIICYGKKSSHQANIIVMVVNLDPNHEHDGFVELPTHKWNINTSQEYQVEDLLTQEIYHWSHSQNYVKLCPFNKPAHILNIKIHDT